MKRFIVSFLTSVACFSASAQQIEFGVRAGFGLAQQKIIDANVSSTGNVRTWNAGAIIEVPTVYNFWVQSGLGIVNTGSVTYQDALTTTTHLTYLQVPVNLIYKLNFPGLGKCYAGGGGYVSRGIAGHFDYETPNSNTTDHISFGNQNDFKGMDYGVNLVAGLELINKLTFNVGYSLGLSNIASQPQQDTGTSEVKNRLLIVGLGYLLR